MSVHEPTVGSEIDYTLVVFDDGSEALAPARVGDLVAFETEKGRPPSTTSIADVLWLVHRAIGSELPFQQWCDSVRRIESDREAVDAAIERIGVPPTSAAAAGGA